MLICRGVPFLIFRITTSDAMITHKQPLQMEVRPLVHNQRTEKGPASRRFQTNMWYVVPVTHLLRND